MGNRGRVIEVRCTKSPTSGDSDNIIYHSIAGHTPTTTTGIFSENHLPNNINASKVITASISHHIIVGNDRLMLG